MKSFAAALVCLGLATAPALGADYDKTEKSPLYELHLRVPEAAMTIMPLKDKILALYKADADQAKTDAREDQDGNPNFRRYSVDTVWRVTFASESVARARPKSRILGWPASSTRMLPGLRSR